MQTEFRRAKVPAELRSLMLFDRKAFSQHPGDRFYRDDWQRYESWWMLVGGRKAGCCAFEPHVDFSEDLQGEVDNIRLDGSLYIASTAILPEFRGFGLGSVLKCWQICYARRNGFERIVTNTRKSNQSMIRLNKKFGFQVIRITAGYYREPVEPTVVMELRVNGHAKGLRRGRKT